MSAGLEAMYQELILDHARHPEGTGDPSASRQASQVHLPAVSFSQRLMRGAIGLGLANQSWTTCLAISGLDTQRLTSLGAPLM